MISEGISNNSCWSCVNYGRGGSTQFFGYGELRISNGGWIFGDKKSDGPDVETWLCFHG